MNVIATGASLSRSVLECASHYSQVRLCCGSDLYMPQHRTCELVSFGADRRNSNRPG
jgi:hypothetical protein